MCCFFRSVATTDLRLAAQPTLSAAGARLMAFATSGHWLASVPAISKPPGILPHQFQSALRHWNYLAYVDLAIQLLYPGSVVQRAQWQREASTQDQKVSKERKNFKIRNSLFCLLNVWTIYLYLIAVVLWHSCWCLSCLLTITRPPLYQ